MRSRRRFRSSSSIWVALLAAAVIVWAPSVAAGSARIVRDVGHGSSPGSEPTVLATSPRVFFDAIDATLGHSLWTSDGTSAGTRLVRDVAPGFWHVDDDLGVVYRNDARVLNGVLVFAGVDSSLWRSDGTWAGTSMLADFAANDTSIRSLGVIGDVMVFTADDGSHGRELWRTDGTAAGTSLVADLQPDGSAFRWSSVLQAASVPAADGSVLFVADEAAAGELWRTDGTAAGTSLVADVREGPERSSIGWLGRVGSVWLFSADDGLHGGELWRTDGTPAGTWLVADVRSGLDGSLPGDPVELPGRLLFTADDGVHGRELWVTDGTLEGTALVRDVAPGGRGADVSILASVGSTVFLSARDGRHGAELWRTDGTAAGTVMVRDVATGAASASPGGGFAYEGWLVFAADDGVHGRELWLSDGTASGTRLVRDLEPGRGSSDPDPLVDVRGRLLVSSGGDDRGSLWRTDGTARGTRRLAAIQATDARVLPDGRAVMVATDGFRGLEPWVTDGTRAGTRLLRDVNVPSSDPRSLVATTGGLAFTADDGERGRELWWTSGTGPSTRLVRDITLSGDRGGREPPDLLVAVGSHVFFAADDGVHGRELWVSAGTRSSTRLVADVCRPLGLCDPAGSSSPQDLHAVGEWLLLTADDGVHGRELWRSDGSVGGTALVADLAPGPDSDGPDGWPRSSFPDVLGGGPGWALVAANAPSGRRRLWLTDGSATGTRPLIGVGAPDRESVGQSLLADGWIYLTAASASGATELWRVGRTSGRPQLVYGRSPLPATPPGHLVELGRRVLFSAEDRRYGRELWATDGSLAGTWLVLDIRPGKGSGIEPDAPQPVALRGSLLFVADDGEHGSQLWRSDGTLAGTRRLTGLEGPPAGLTVVGDRVFFTADDGVHGREVWSTDGTRAGTRLEADLRRGPAGSGPDMLTAYRGDLFLVADDGRRGRELWRIDHRERGAARGRSRTEAATLRPDER